VTFPQIIYIYRPCVNIIMSVDFRFMPTFYTLKRDMMLLCLGCAAGVSMFFTRVPWVSTAGFCALTYSTLSFPLIIFAFSVCKLSNLSNAIYAAILLHRALALVLSALTTVTYVYVWDTGSVEVGWMAVSAAIVVFLRAASIMYITNLFVWDMYAPRIRDSIMTQTCFRALYSYARDKSNSGVLISGGSEGTEWCLHSVHKVLQSSMWNDVESTPSDVWYMLVQKLDGASVATVNASASTLLNNYTNSASSPLRRTAGRFYRSPHISRSRSASPAPDKTLMASKKFTLSRLADCIEDSLSESLTKAMGLTSGSDKVTKDRFESALRRAAESRTALKRTLHDYLAITSKLDAGLTGLSCVVVAILWGFIFGVDYFEAGVTWLSMIVAFSFCFGDTVKRLFEGLILVFVWQPFGVSDRVFILDDNKVEMNLLVSNINLLTTEFIRSDGQLCVISNSIIQQRDVRNASRALFNSTVFTVKLREDVDTDVLSRLQSHLEDYRMDKWCADVKSLSVQLRAVRNNGLTSTALVVLVHSQNFEDDDHRYLIHDAFARTMHDFLRLEQLQNIDAVHLDVDNVSY
jgi:small-conductance mechanosensitive channel